MPATLQYPAKLEDDLALNKSTASVVLRRGAQHGGMLTRSCAGVHESCIRDVIAVASLWLDLTHPQASQLAVAASAPYRWRLCTVSVMPPCLPSNSRAQPEMF